MKNYSFNEQSTRRIAKGIKRLEHLPPAPPRGGSRRVTGGFSPIYKAKLNESETLSGSSPATPATGTIYTGAPTEEEATESAEIEIYGTLLSSGDTLDDSVWLFITVVDGRWEVIAAQCSASAPEEEPDP
jgi:hypothetical protein